MTLTNEEVAFLLELLGRVQISGNLTPEQIRRQADLLATIKATLEKEMDNG